MMNPIVKIRRLATPPCSKCAKYYFSLRQDGMMCKNPEAVDYYERMTGREVSSVTCSLIRGGRFCKFKDATGK